MATMFFVLVAALSLSWGLMEHHRRWELEEKQREDVRLYAALMDEIDEARTRGW